MSQPMLVYVAGPYSPIPGRNVLQNIRAAERVAIAIWQNGHYALCPHKNTAHFEGLAPHARWLEGDLEMLRRCDAICMTPRWRESEGARAELGKAKEWGLGIYYDMADLPVPHSEAVS